MTALQLHKYQMYRHVYQEFQSTGLLGMQRERKMCTCPPYIFKLPLYRKPQIISVTKFSTFKGILGNECNLTGETFL